MLVAILLFVGCWFAVSFVVAGLWCALVVPRTRRDYPPVDLDDLPAEIVAMLDGEAV